MGNWHIFIQENAFENVVCEMMAILSQPKYKILYIYADVITYAWHMYETWVEMLMFSCPPNTTNSVTQV